MKRLKALASEHRLRILELLSDCDIRSFSEMCYILKMSTGMLGPHLKFLVDTGFVEKLPLGKYQITDLGIFALNRIRIIERLYTKRRWLCGEQKE